MQDFSLEQCNHTELLQLARRAGLRAPGAWPRATLIALLKGELPPAPYDPIENLRDGIMSFVIAFEAVLRAQLTCPAQTLDPRACYGCVDLVPVFCLRQVGPQAEQTIQLHRKPKTP